MMVTVGILFGATITSSSRLPEGTLLSLGDLLGDSWRYILNMYIH